MNRSINSKRVSGRSAFIPFQARRRSSRCRARSGFSFAEGFHWPKSASASDSLDFFFSRAIDRGALFYAKTSLYLAACLLPFMVIWVYGTMNPVIKLELPYRTAEHREATKEFYLKHFEGAYLQKDPHDRQGNKAWIVLPHGRVTRAIFSFALGVVNMLLFQGLFFAFWRKPWGVYLAFALFMVASLWGYGWSPLWHPSLYERGIVWVGQHTIPVFMGLGILLVASQMFYCRRFVNTEITA